MTKTSRLDFKYLDNEKSFQDEIKGISHHFPKAFIEANKTVDIWLMLAYISL